MGNSMQELLKRFSRNRRLSRRVGGVLVVLAAVVAVGVAWGLHMTGVAMTADVSCGLEEHTHTDECYDEDGNLTCGLEEHTHTVDCLGETDGDATEAVTDDGESDDSDDESTATANDGIATVADDDATADYSTYVGGTVSITGTSGSNHSWSSSDTSVATVSSSGATATVTGVAAGTVTITHTYYTNSSGGGWQGGGGSSQTQVTETFTVEITKNVKVYVYVAAYDDDGNLFSDEMLELLGISKSTLDGNGYFPAGEIELDPSFLTGKNYTTQGAALLTSTSDWTDLLAALSNMDTSTLIDMTGMTVDNSAYAIDYTPNKGNSVASYLSNAAQDVGYTWGSQHSALFRWNMSTSYGFEDQTVQYHLDLRFSTVKITYIFGENGITSSDDSIAYDGNTAGTKVFITGATMDYTPTITAPAGWKIVGYYTTSDFQEETEWNAVGQPINDDTTVYIKIVPEDNVVINYVVAVGEGTVTNPSNSNAEAQSGYESFNPTTGSATGSTAAAANDYEFVGWYSDESCSDEYLISDDAKYVPTSPNGEGKAWPEGYEVTYYAKFVKKTYDVSLKKVDSKDNSVTLTGAVFTLTTTSTDDEGNETTTYYKDDGNSTKEYTTLETSSEGTISITGLASGTYTLTEVVAPDGYGLLDSAITIEVSSSGIKVGDSAYASYSDGVVLIENVAGTELPNTGGTGTILTAVAGCVLVAGASVMLATKRRRSQAR